MSDYGTGTYGGGVYAALEEPGVPAPEPSPGPPAFLEPALGVEWRFHLVESDTMERLGELHQARGRTLQLVMNRSGAASFTIPLNDELFVDAEAIKHGIIVYRNDLAIWSGMIWTIDESFSADRAGVNCVGWFETLNRRILRQDVSYPRYQTPIVPITGGEMVFANPNGVPTDVDYHPGGFLTIANAQRDTWIVEGASTDTMQRINSYARGQSIGAAITDLSDVEAGYDFMIDPITRVMDIRNWDEYDDLSDTVSFGHNWGPNNLIDSGRQLDASTMVNRMAAMGKFGGGLAEDLDSQAEFQLFEEEASLSEVVNPDVLLAYAGGEVLLRKTPRVMYRLAPFPWVEGRTPEPFIDYQLGDKVEFSAKHLPRISIDKQAVRVFGLSISISEEGNPRIAEIQVTPT